MTTLTNTQWFDNASNVVYWGNDFGTWDKQQTQPQDNQYLWVQPYVESRRFTPNEIREQTSKRKENQGEVALLGILYHKKGLVSMVDSHIQPNLKISIF